MKVLVTGGSGFIGSAVCRLFAAEGDAVVNLDKLTYAADPRSVAEAAATPGYRFVQADVADAGAVRAAFAEHRPEAVVHLAAESHVDRSIDDPGVFVTTNVVGTYTLLQAALDHWRGLEGEARARFRLLHVSTDEVYGSLGPEGRFAEETRYDPRSPYSASKAGADHLASAWFHTFGLPVMISNCSNNYGPYHFPEKLIPLALLNALEGLPVPVYGDGGQARDWLHVEDHARALRLILAAGAPGRTYNIGGDAERTNLQVAHGVCDLIDRFAPPLPRGGRRRGLVTFVEDRPGHDRRYAVDAARLRSELGWRPRFSFEAGLEATVRWYLARGDWWEPLRARYAGERLGLKTAAA